jgi:hypothetical protein
MALDKTNCRTSSDQAVDHDALVRPLGENKIRRLGDVLARKPGTAAPARAMLPADVADRIRDKVAALDKARRKARLVVRDLERNAKWISDSLADLAARPGTSSEMWMILSLHADRFQQFADACRLPATPKFGE